MNLLRFSSRLLPFAVFALPISAQTLFVPSGTSGIGSSSNGNVGIGTSNPAYSLYSSGDIGVSSNRQFVARYGNDESYKATFGWSHLQLGNNGSNWIVAGRTTVGGSLTFIVNNTSDYAYGGYNGIQAMTIAADGKVGVGTTTPGIQFDVKGAYNTPLLRANYADACSAGIGVDADGTYWGAAIFQNGTKRLVVDSNGAVLIGSSYVTGNGPDEGLAVQGNVAIGTTNPGTYKLAVNGSIHAKEVVVEIGWSDYVFDDGYKLAPLSEVEQRIKAEHHLPGMPSAQEVAEHGVSMGEMQSKLLAKIEELTLHQIEQEKTLSEQQKQLEIQRAEIFALKNQLNRPSFHP